MRFSERLAASWGYWRWRSTQLESLISKNMTYMCVRDALNLSSCEILDIQSVKSNFDHKSTTPVSWSSQQSDTEPGLLSPSLWITRDRARLSVFLSQA